MRICRLDEIPAGSSARICALDDGHAHAPALRRLGFREGAMVEVLSGHDPVLVRCEGSCVAVGRCMLTGVSIIHSGRAKVCSECPPEPAADAGLRPVPGSLGRKGLGIRFLGRRG